MSTTPNAEANVSRRVRELVARAEAAEAVATSAVLTRLEQLIGADALKEMLADRQAVVDALGHPDAPMRRAALHLAFHHWKMAGELVERSEAFARQDPDPAVRETAIHVLNVRHAGSNDPRVGQLLAAVVRSEAEPERVRLVAYRGLVSLRGLALGWRPSLVRLRFPADVDWAFVDSFLPGQPAAVG